MTRHLPETASDIVTAVKSGAVSATAITKAALERIAEGNARVGAFTDVTAERALREAEAVDLARKNGQELGPLAGVPYGVKNLYDIEGLTTLAGSKINRAHPPAASDAVLVKRMAGAGAVLLGGLNMGEYAYDFTGNNVHYGPSRNPLDTDRMTGGSSGGSAAAVAAGFVPVSLGSDTNGSIRVPSSFCGLYGLKPTYGRLPRTGTFPFVDSIDHLGPFARSTADLALSYDVLQGHDAGDPVCTKRDVAPVSAELAKGIDGLRIAVAGGYFRANAMPDVLAAVDRAARAVGATKEIQIPNALTARAAAFLITNTEGSAFHLARLRQQAEDFDPDTRDRFLAGALLPSSWYISAQRFRRKYEEEMRAVFKECDVFLAPSTPFSAPRLDEVTMTFEGKVAPLRPNIGIFTQPISFIGLPVAAVPVYGKGPMPFGIQVIGKPWREDLCMRVAHALEAANLGRLSE